MSGLFAINKPSGISSAGLLNDLQNILKHSPLFEAEIKAQQARTNAGRKGKKQKFNNKLKMGHGGTLDPLASGVLVVGTGRGTKDLGKFLHCSKDYEAIALFGCSTDTYDSEGKVVHRKPWQHITQDKIESVLHQFRGEIMQTPPIYSALKMQGKPLYEYAREGKPLPAEIKARPATVSRFEVTKIDTQHEWTFPKEDAPVEIILSAEVLQDLPKDKPTQPAQQTEDASHEMEVHDSSAGSSEPPTKRQRQEPVSETSAASGNIVINENGTGQAGLAVHLSMTVSSGTYVRSLIHDLGIALGSAAHMVALVRKRVGQFKLEDSIDWPSFEQDNWQAQIKKRLDFGSELDESDANDLMNTLTFDPKAVLQQVSAFLKPCMPFKRTLTYAQSLDAKISGPDSKPLTISCRESFCVTHELRRRHDMILIGVGTAMSDNPGLNARAPAGQPYPLMEQPIPVILDPNGRLKLTSEHKMVQNAANLTGKMPIQLIGDNLGEPIDSEAINLYIPCIEGEEDGKVRFLWEDVYAALQTYGSSIMIEGGARIIKDVLEQNAADQIIVTVAPTYVGEGTNLDLESPVKLTGIRSEIFGRDTVTAASLISG